LTQSVKTQLFPPKVPHGSVGLFSFGGDNIGLEPAHAPRA